MSGLAVFDTSIFVGDESRGLAVPASWLPIVSFLTLAELQLGVQLAAARGDEPLRARRQATLDSARKATVVGVTTAHHDIITERLVCAALRSQTSDPGARFVDSGHRVGSRRAGVDSRRRLRCGVRSRRGHQAVGGPRWRRTLCLRRLSSGDWYFSRSSTRVFGSGRCGISSVGEKRLAGLSAFNGNCPTLTGSG
jgi:hypothetical protein